MDPLCNQSYYSEAVISPGSHSHLLYIFCILWYNLSYIYHRDTKAIEQFLLLDGSVPTATCFGFGRSVNTCNGVHPGVLQVVGMMVTLQ